MNIEWQKYQGVIKFPPLCQDRIYSKSSTLKRFYIGFLALCHGKLVPRGFLFGFLVCLFVWFLRQKGRIQTLFNFTVH